MKNIGGFQFNPNLRKKSKKGITDSQRKHVNDLLKRSVAIEKNKISSFGGGSSMNLFSSPQHMQFQKAFASSRRRGVSRSTPNKSSTIKLRISEVEVSTAENSKQKKPVQNVSILWEHLSSYLPVTEVFSFSGVIGQGSFSKVYKGAIKATLERVAIKVIPKSKFVKPRRRKMLQNEVAILAKLDHPGIAKFKLLHEDLKNVNTQFLI